jgi:hypothetical protein
VVEELAVLYQLSMMHHLTVIYIISAEVTANEDDAVALMVIYPPLLLLVKMQILVV